MLKATSKKIAARVDAKAAQLAAKRMRSENAYADAIAYCEANKVRGTDRAGYIAFASTAMQVGSARGAIASAVLLPGKTGTYTFAEIAKRATALGGKKVSVADCNNTNLAYITHNVEFRRDLVGFVVSFDMSAETVSVRPYKVAEEAPRKPAAKKPSKASKPASEQTEPSVNVA